MTVESPPVQRTASGAHRRRAALTFAHLSMPYAIILAVALTIGCSRMGSSGPLWPDSSQYANAGAMIRDWLVSGELLRPYEFALGNYAQYPAFHLPYHPPGYPAVLGLAFTLTGVSYVTARVVTALFLFAAAAFFHALLRRTGASRAGALLGSLLLATMPEVALWSRDTMSEIPGLAFILAGTYFFVVWLQNGRYSAYLAAFGLAGCAFMSRYLTAGVLPAWFLWALAAGQVRSLARPRFILAPALYLAVNALYTAMALRYSKFEVGYGAPRPNRNYADAFSFEALSFYAAAVPETIGWLAVIAAIAGFVCLMRSRAPLATKAMWPCWLLSYLLFVLMVGIYGENRYVIFAVPAFSALAAVPLSFASGARAVVVVTAFLLTTAIGLNVHRVASLPSGLVGYESVARRLTQVREPGNILVASPQHGDLTFRYRSHDLAARRTFIRADRTLAVRPPSYTDAPTEIVARETSDVIEIIRRGRIRYVVAAAGGDQTAEAALLLSVLQSNPDRFALISEHPLSYEYSGPAHRDRVFVWRYSGDLPSGPSELPVIVPTADMVISPSS